MDFRELTNEEFNNFTNSYNLKSVYQTIEYGFIMNEENFDTIFLGLVIDNEIKAASLILIDKDINIKKAYAPRGFLIDYKDAELMKVFTKEIKKYLFKRNIVSIKIAPIITKDDVDYKSKFRNLTKLGYRHLGYQNFFEGLKPRYEAVIDLTISYYELFKNIRKEFRTKIRSAESNGIKVYKGNETDLDKLYLQTKRKYPRELEYFKNCYRFFNRKNMIDFYYTKLDTSKYLKQISKKYSEQEKICENLDMELVKNPDILKEKMANDLLLHKYKNNLIYATKLLNNYPDGIVLSSILLVKYNKTIYMLMDGYDSRYKRLNAKHLLIWKLLEKFSKEGYKEFNFGGITNPEIKDSKFDGLNKFKLNFNSKAIEYAGDFELVINKPYHLIKNIFKK